MASPQMRKVAPVQAGRFTERQGFLLKFRVIAVALNENESRVLLRHDGRLFRQTRVERVRSNFRGPRAFDWPPDEAVRG